MAEKYLIDSNILVYAFDSSETKKHEKAKSLIGEIARTGKGVLSTQNLAEFHSAITKKPEKKPPKDYTLNAITDLKNSFTILKPEPETILAAIKLEAEQKIHFWDALIAATMAENGIRTIYTENTKDFKKIPGLKAINPL